jgi:hypothetical protein
MYSPQIMNKARSAFGAFLKYDIESTNIQKVLPRCIWGRRIESIYEARDNRHENSSAAGVGAGAAVRYGGGVAPAVWADVVTVRAG